MQIPDPEHEFSVVAETEGPAPGVIFVPRKLPGRFYWLAREARPGAIVRVLARAGLDVKPDAIGEYADWLAHARVESYAGTGR
ncbi:hypothetical protein ABVK25_008770 [Lepraria finkii]|uniref:Uncharacterized protein n=1 Tax=Lepraria finkii TaxID=1340010 RepID=A0ABR4AZK9_9LECA